MKKYLLLFTLALLFSFVYIGCEDDSTGPDPVGPVGSLRIESSPTGATVFIDNTNRGTTNTTIQNVATGNRSVRLELEGYRDTTVSVTIVENQESFVQVQLTPTTTAPDLTPYGPVRIYETTGTTAAQPSGLDLSTGQAHGISGAGNTNVDLYYFTNSLFTVHEIRSAHLATGLTRNTAFQVGTGTNLDDGTDSPLATNQWASTFSDNENNYIFVFDADGHYSKIRIVNSGGGSGNPGDPAWVEIQWLYNEAENDNRF